MFDAGNSFIPDNLRAKKKIFEPYFFVWLLSVHLKNPIKLLLYNYNALNSIGETHWKQWTMNIKKK